MAWSKLERDIAAAVFEAGVAAAVLLALEGTPLPETEAATDAFHVAARERAIQHAPQFGELLDG